MKTKQKERVATAIMIDLVYRKSKRAKFEIKQYLRFEIKDGGGVNVSSNPNFTSVYVNNFVLVMYVVVIHF